MKELSVKELRLKDLRVKELFVTMLCVKENKRQGRKNCVCVRVWVCVCERVVCEKSVRACVCERVAHVTKIVCDRIVCV